MSNSSSSSETEKRKGRARDEDLPQNESAVRRKREVTSDSTPSTSASAAAASASSSSSSSSDAANGNGGEFEIEFEDQFPDDVDPEDAEIEEETQKRESAKNELKVKSIGNSNIILEEDDGELDDVVHVVDDEDSKDAMDTSDTGKSEAKENGKRQKYLGKVSNAGKTVTFDEESLKDDDKDDEKKKVWRPGVDPSPVAGDEELDYDSSAYLMLHRLKVEWPCLSFDIIPDTLGVHRIKFPHTMYLVAGTQADKTTNNKISVMKCSELHKTMNDDKESDDEDAEDDENDLDDDPILEEKSMPHPGTVNRIRVMPQNSCIVATWSAEARVYVWNVESLIRSLDTPGAGMNSSSSSSNARKGGAGAGQGAGGGSKKPIHICKEHKSAGYAMDWSRLVSGRLVTGDNDKNIFLWNQKDGGFSVDPVPFTGHAKSVEDLQWSPIEETVFASASADKTIRIWDTRAKSKPQAFVVAHHSDVNVISWNRKVQHLVASGSDDGTVRIWDLRNFTSKNVAATLSYHKKYITSVEWSPFEESVLAVAGADDMVTIWDLAVEADAEEVAELRTGASTDGMELPQMLYFVHQGLKNPKELHWHQQISSAIVTTAEDGFNIFRPSNLQ